MRADDRTSTCGLAIIRDCNPESLVFSARREQTNYQEMIMKKISTGLAAALLATTAFCARRSRSEPGAPEAAAVRDHAARRSA